MVLMSELEGPQKLAYELFKLQNFELLGIQDLLIIKETVVDSISTVYNLLLPLGYALLIMYFILDLIDKYTIGGGRQMPVEQLFSCLMRLFVVCTIMSYGGDVLEKIIELGNAFVTAVNGQFSEESSSVEVINKAIYDYYDNANMLEAILTFPIGLGMYIWKLVPNLMIIFHALQRQLEIVIRGGFAAISFPDILTEGKNSNGVKFLKRFTATLLHGGTMVIVITVAQSLTMTTDVDNFVFNPVNIFAIAAMVLNTFAAIGMLSTAKTIINEALGA